MSPTKTTTSTPTPPQSWVFVYDHKLHGDLTGAHNDLLARANLATTLEAAGLLAVTPPTVHVFHARRILELSLRVVRDPSAPTQVEDLPAAQTFKVQCPRCDALLVGDLR